MAARRMLLLLIVAAALQAPPAVGATGLATRNGLKLFIPALRRVYGDEYSITH